MNGGRPEENELAKPNYQFEKRQRELAKKKKQEEKRLRKASRGEARAEEQPAQPPAAEEPVSK